MKNKEKKEFDEVVKKAAKLIVNNGGNTQQAAEAIRNLSRRERRLIERSRKK